MTALTGQRCAQCGYAKLALEHMDIEHHDFHEFVPPVASPVAPAPKCGDSWTLLPESGGQTLVCYLPLGHGGDHLASNNWSWTNIPKPAAAPLQETTTAAPSDDETEREFHRAMTCIALELPDVVYRDFKSRVFAHVRTLEKRLATQARTLELARAYFAAKDAWASSPVAYDSSTMSGDHPLYTACESAEEAFRDALTTEPTP
jgi:hypothetical protein